jgi:hypothetical protein
MCIRRGSILTILVLVVVLACQGGEDIPGNGRLTSVTAPANHRGQRYQLHYTYDAEARTHVARVEDSFGYSSTAARWWSTWRGGGW